MRFVNWFSTAVISAGVRAGCRKASKPATALRAVALTAALAAGASAQITGQVSFKGDPPEMPAIAGIQAIPQCAALHKDPVYDDSVVVADNGAFANVIVFIKPDKGQTLTGPQKTTPEVLAQKGCMYTPHVLAIETGQPLMVKNEDPFLHNVHAMSIDNPSFNFAQIGTGSDKAVEPFKTVETFQIKCDVHPWMKAVVRVFDNPYFAVTGPDGKYSIDTKGLKDGTYTIEAWQETYHDAAPQTVEVKDGKVTKKVDFTYKPGDEKKSEAAPFVTIHLASADCPACKAAASKVQSIANSN